MFHFCPNDDSGASRSFFFRPVVKRAASLSLSLSHVPPPLFLGAHRLGGAVGCAHDYYSEGRGFDARRFPDSFAEFWHEPFSLSFRLLSASRNLSFSLSSEPSLSFGFPRLLHLPRSRALSTSYPACGLLMTHSASANREHKNSRLTENRRAVFLCVFLCEFGYQHLEPSAVPCRVGREESAHATAPALSQPTVFGRSRLRVVFLSLSLSLS